MDDTAFSSIDFVVMCLLDKERTEGFRSSIASSVTSNHDVLELGTGSGILSMFAAKAGAKHVTAIEYDPYIAHAAEKNIKHNGLDSTIEVVIADARSHTFPSGTYFDVVIAELLTTGMVDEFQVDAINNLHAQGVVDDETIFIPSVQNTYAEPCETTFSAYGFDMPMVTHIWRFYRSVTEYPIKKIAEKELVSSIDFSKQNPELTDVQLQFMSRVDAYANSIYLTSTTLLPNGPTLGATDFLNGDVIIPVTNPQNVNKGDILKIRIRYTFGAGYSGFVAEII